jgi:hypothetical protein
MGGPPADEAERRRREQQRIQRQLDEALADSFPASDPVSIVTSQGEDWEEDEPQVVPETENPAAPPAKRP